MDLVIGIDLATSEVRVLAADATGKTYGTAARSLAEPRAPKPGWSEQDPETWWPATASALAELTGLLGQRTHSVAAVSVSATSATVVGLDAHGKPAGSALTYADQRATAEAATVQAAAAGTWDALGLTMAPSFGLPKWAWMLGHPPGNSRIARLAHASDLIVEQLVGRPSATDWSHALKSGYDPVNRRWVEEAMDALGIPVLMLPEVLPPGTPAGRVSRSACYATGLPAGCLVRLGMTDSCAAQLSTGAAAPGRFVSVLGTTLVLKGASLRPVSDPSGAVYSHLHPGGWWLPGGASSTGGKALVAGFPEADLAELDSLADRRGPATVVVYPLLGRGERFPFAAPQAEGFAIGRPADELERYRAILEGVAFVERLGYERLSRLGAASVGPISTSGRASASRTWNKIRATVLDTVLEAKPKAGTALGACILAAAGTLHPDLASATAAMSVRGEQVHPDTAEREMLDRSYHRFVATVVDRGWLGEPR